MWRDYSAQSEVPVQLHIQKMRNRRAGALGCGNMFWSYTTGCYYESEFMRKEAERIAYREIERI
jgi:hypothetical protein